MRETGVLERLSHVVFGMSQSQGVLQALCALILGTCTSCGPAGESQLSVDRSQVVKYLLLDEWDSLNPSLGGEFVLRNSSDRTIVTKLCSISCSCFSVDVDGVVVAPGKYFSIEAGQCVALHMVLEPRREAGRQDFSVECQDAAGLWPRIQLTPDCAGFEQELC